jgi:hypothetical protein
MRGFSGDRIDMEDLKQVDQLTEEEKEKCISPPGDAYF